MALEPESKAELSKAGARLVATAGAPGRELHERQAGGNGGIQTPQRMAMIPVLQDRHKRKSENLATLITAIRVYVAEEHSELEKLERWLGTI